MAYQKNFDYTAALKKATDPLEKERLEREKAEKIADIQRAGLDYTKAADITKFNTGGVPTTVTTPQPTPQQTPQSTPQPTQAIETGIVFDEGSKVWVDKATGKVVNRPGQDQFGVLAKQLADAQKQKNIAALQQAYDKTFSSLQAEKSGLEPMFGAQTRQAVTQSTMGKKSFSDFLAEKGLGGSGLSGQGEIAQNVALQGELGGIEARKGQAFADVARRMTEAQQARDYGIAGAESDAAMLNAQQQLERLKQQEQRDYAEQQAGKEEQKQLQQQREQNYLATINPLEDQTAIIQQLKAQGVPDDDYRIVAHQKVRVAKLGQMADQQYQSELAKIKDDKEREEQAFETAKWKFEQGMPADSVTATLLRIPVGSVIPSQRIKEAQLQLDKIRALKSGTTKPKADKPNVTVSDFEKGIEMQFPEESTAQEESAIAARYIAEGISNGTISVKDAERLAVRYGVTESMIRSYTDQQKFNVMKNL